MEGKKFVGICSDDGSRAVVNANPWEQRKLGELVKEGILEAPLDCLLYTSPSPRDA